MSWEFSWRQALQKAALSHFLAQMSLFLTETMFSDFKARSPRNAPESCYNQLETIYYYYGLLLVF